MKRSFPAALIGGLLVATPALAQTPPPVTSHFVFAETVSLTPGELIGKTPLGERHRVPITGGYFAGPGLSGQIVPGGADWQLVRADGSLVIDADYIIRTDDGVMIHVHNVGIVVRPGAGRSGYALAAPVFEAPLGKYGWMNDALFISTLGPAGDKAHPAVKITIYQLDPPHRGE